MDLEAWLYHLAEQHVIHPGAKDPQFNHAYRLFLTENANMLPASLQHLREADAKSHSKISNKPPKVRKHQYCLFFRVNKFSQVSIDDFELVKVIGKGSFGKVTLVQKKSDGKLYAMKVYSLFLMHSS
jgi:hypothetical protein